MIDDDQSSNNIPSQKSALQNLDFTKLSSINHNKLMSKEKPKSTLMLDRTKKKKKYKKNDKQKTLSVNFDDLV